MSSKHQLLRDLVVERLVLCANDIFALFERSLADYEEELVRCRTMCRTMCRNQEEAEGESAHLGVTSEIKFELRETPVEVPFSPFQLKSEEPLDNSCFYQQHEEVEEEEEEEVPGCSGFVPDTDQYEPYSCSDTDNSEDWGKAGEVREGQGKAGEAREEMGRAGEAREEMGRAGEAREEKRKAGESREEQGRAGEAREGQGKAGEAREVWRKSVRARSNRQTFSSVHSDVTLTQANNVLNCGFASAERPHLEWSEAFVNRQTSHRYVGKPPIAGGKEKPFSCSVCKKTFPQKRNLKSHMRVHTGERPYRCEPCGLSFKFQQNFCQHDLAVHRKDKPFRCRLCKKDFEKKLEMVAHRRTHDSSFSCSACGKDFSCKKYLTRHGERCAGKRRSQRGGRGGRGGRKTS